MIPNTDACPFCAAPAPELDSCHHCHDRGLTGLQSVQADWIYQTAIIELIHRAKAAADPAALRALCQLVRPVPYPIDVVTVIPATPGRRPGKHLATALARTQAQLINKPFANLLRLTRTPAHQHELSAADRNRNTAGLFQARNKIAVSHVLLVDDLLTSGATLSAAARTLKAAGCQRVSGYCIARTPFQTG